MTLKTLFPHHISISDVEISSLHNDSRLVDKNSLFIAYTGFEVDVHQFIGDAYQKGCRSFLVAQDRVSELSSQHLDTVMIGCEDLKKEMSRVALVFYDYPDRALTLIGVTGTNGKTTTATLIAENIKAQGYKTSFFGTVEWRVGDQIFPAPNTTPDFLSLVQMLRQSVNQGVTHVVMEVASHALSLGRVEGLAFDVALFTNLTQDHLDYHKTLEDYYIAKARLFLKLLALSPKKHKKAFINADDPYGQRLLRILGERGVPTASFSTRGLGLWNAEEITLSVTESVYSLCSGNTKITVQTDLLGEINVYNTAMAIILLLHLKLPQDKILESIAHIKIPGRLQKVDNSHGITFLVDYSHTPDALSKAIDVVQTILTSGKKSLVVFGAGGDRDPTKRSLMAQAAQKADWVIVTSDNPRTEDPEMIIQDIIKGFDSMDHVEVEVDRKKALVLAYKKANVGDVVLVAGKGHENYQILGKTKIHFSDVEEIQKICQTPKESL